LLYIRDMLKRSLAIFTILTSLLFTGLLASAQIQGASQNSPAEWSEPYQPFRIAGNLYYVGTADLACYLITTKQGNILINTGLASSEPIIKSNIEALGFKFEDIKILLTTQAHFDHMGAMAAIKKVTGAVMMVDQEDAGVMEDGGSSDYALGGSSNSYEPVQANRLLHDGDFITLGGMNLKMLHHPGHTKGSCSFLFDVTDEKRSYRVLIANMPSIVTQKKFSEIPQYPGIIKDYTKTFKSLRSLSFDIWLASHASQFALRSKHKLGDAYKPEVFIDRKGYDAVLADLQKQFTKKLNSE
jgi:metallo-beta-lactamase class B